MKKLTTTLITCAALCILFTNSYAQVQITPFGGYAFADKFTTVYGHAQVSDAALYGLDLNIPITHGAEVELSYERQDSHIFSYNSVYPEFDNEKIPVSVNYFLVGGIYGRNLGNYPVQTFGGISLGAVLVDGKDQGGMNWGSELLFDLNAKLGVKVFPGEGRVGFRLQTQLNVPFQGVGSSISCGAGGVGCGFAVGTFTTIVQFGFMGGIIIKVGGERESHEIYTN